MLGMSGGQLQKDERPHTVPDGHDSPKAELLN
jgi:hypothetical protein